MRAGVLACVLALAGCAGSHPPSQPPETVRSAVSVNRIRTELYFGLDRPGGQVSADEWRAFLDGFVTPRFPKGLSICEVSGQWKNAQGALQKEFTKLLILIHEGSGAQNGAIEDIRAEYKKRFQQESVLRVDVPVGASY